MWQSINPLTYTNLPNQDSDIILATWKPFSQQGESSHRWSDQLLVTLPRQVGLTIPSFRYFSLGFEATKEFSACFNMFLQGFHPPGATILCCCRLRRLRSTSRGSMCATLPWPLVQRLGSWMPSVFLSFWHRPVPNK